MPSRFPNKPSARVLKHTINGSANLHELTHAGKRYLIEPARLTYKRMPCMTVVSVEVSEIASLECCLFHEEDANAGPSSVDQRSSDHTAREASSLFPDSEGRHGYHGPCMHFMHNDARIPHMGATGATETLTFLGSRQNKRHSIH
jgi:hypothetical protein